MRGRGMLLVVVLGAVALRLALALQTDAPHLFPDEVGYLAAARELAGQEPGLVMGPVPMYFPLYAVLLAPFFALGLSTSAAITAAMVLNALLGGVIVAAAHRAVRVLLRCSWETATLAAVVVAALPAFTLIVSTAWADALLPAVILGWLLAVHRWMIEDRWRNRALVVLAATAAYWTHPRGVVVLGLTGVLGIAVGFLGRRSWLLAVAVVVTYLGSRWAVPTVLDDLYRSSDVAIQDDAALGRLVDPGAWPNIVSRLVGVLWYQVVATGGLAVLGVWALSRGARATLREARRSKPGDLGALTPIVLLALVAAFAVGSAAFHRGERLDVYLYGRYLDAAMPAAVAAGVVELIRVRTRPVRAVAVVAALLFGLTVGVLAVVPDDREGSLVTDMVLGLAPHFNAFGTSPGGLVAIAVAGLASLGLMAALVGRRPAMVGVVVAVLGAGAALIARQGILQPPYVATDTVAEFADDVAALSQGAPVGFDLGFAASRRTTAYGYEWFRPDLAPYDIAEADQPRSPWLVGPLRWPLAADFGAELVFLDASRDTGLYVLPGPEQDQLVEAGAVLPLDFPAVLVPSAAKVRYDGPVSATARSGSGDPLAVDVTHVGRSVRWSHYEAGGGGFEQARVRVGARAVDPETGGVVAAFAVDLPRDLIPGESAEVVLRPGEHLSPGRYRLVVDLEQVDVGRFSERYGQAPLTVDLTVR